MAGPALDLVGNPRADTVTGPAAEGDIGEDVVATLRAVRASDSLSESLRPSSRAPGHLWWSWGVVSEDELRDVVGFAPLRLPGPATMPHRRHEFDEDGTVRLPGVRTDCAVVRVHDTDVAVQVDVSGAVALWWRLV